MILGSIALVAIFPNPLTYIVAVILIGSRQLGLAILMHDGAHGCLSRNEKRNLFLSQWFCAYPVFAETLAYRRYHLTHHMRTQQEDDPDLVLSAPFPITRASYRRKFWRDISGQTGYEQRKAQILNALGDPAWPWRRRLWHFNEKLGPQILTNAILFAGLAAAGVWWAYPLLWLVPLLTWQMVITRIRNIAEHAVVPDGDDPLRNTRTTRANLLERALIAPYFVNYHLEHHLLYLRALLQPAQTARDHDARAARGAHGGAAELFERAAARDRKACRRGQARRDRQQRAPHARRSRGQQGPRPRGVLTSRDPTGSPSRGSRPGPE